MTSTSERTLMAEELNTDLLSGLTPEELCERPEDGTCEKCGAGYAQGCQLDKAREPSITERAYGEMWGRWAEGMAKQLGIDNE